MVRFRRSDYAGKRLLVIGGGHSAINGGARAHGTSRRSAGHRDLLGFAQGECREVLGGGLNDQLPERGALGVAARKAMEDGRPKMLAPFSVESVREAGSGLAVAATLAGKPFSLAIDRIVVTTGFRPDLSFLGELRVALDPRCLPS